MLPGRRSIWRFALLPIRPSLMQPPPTSERTMERVRGMVRRNPPAPERRRQSWFAGLFPISLPQTAAFASVALVAFILGASLPYWGGGDSTPPAASSSDPVAATANVESAEDSNSVTIGDLAIVDGLPDPAENGTVELASSELATTESVDSLTDIPLQ